MQKMPDEKFHNVCQTQALQPMQAGTGGKYDACQKQNTDLEVCLGTCVGYHAALRCYYSLSFPFTFASCHTWLNECETLMS